jgi:hypothetical protein
VGQLCLLCGKKLTFNVNAENDHAGVDLIENIREFKILIPAMDIIEAVTEFDLR